MIRMNSMIRMSCKRLWVLAILLASSACQRITYDYAKIEEPKHKPNYQLKFPSEYEGGESQVLLDINRPIAQ